MLNGIFKRTNKTPKAVAPVAMTQAEYDQALISAAVDTANTGDLGPLKAAMTAPGYAPDIRILTAALATTISQSCLESTKGAPVEALEMLVKAGALVDSETGWAGEPCSRDGFLYKGWYDPFVQAAWAAEKRDCGKQHLDFVLHKGVKAKSAVRVAEHFAGGIPAAFVDTAKSVMAQGQGHLRLVVM